MKVKPQIIVNFGDEPAVLIPWWHPFDPENVNFKDREETVHFFRKCLGMLPRELLLAMHEAVFEEMADMGANEALGRGSYTDYTPQLVFVPAAGDPKLQ